MYHLQHGVAVNNEVLAIILGGGQGSRLFPLTQLRSKPAVPLGGKYRLIDIPVSNCLHADIRRIFVLTQFNSASLNRHISQTYRMDLFSPGFVEILAAEITPENTNWFQGTADAVRKAARHFLRYEADYYLILAGDHLYRMDYSEMVDAHIDRRADITIAAQPCAPADATQMGIFRFDRDGHIVAFEEKPNAARLAEIGQSIPKGAVAAGHTPEKPFVASMGVYVFSREVLMDLLEKTDATDFGREWDRQDTRNRPPSNSTAKLSCSRCVPCREPGGLSASGTPTRANASASNAGSRPGRARKSR